MAASETEIANLALGHLGQSVEISNLQTTRTPEAIALRTIYDTMRRATLRDFAWPFAHKIAALGLVSTYGVDVGHPTSEYKFAYRVPSDCLIIRKLQSGVNPDNRQSRIPFKTSRDASGALILTNLEDAVAEYTIDIQEVEKYTDDFVLAFSLRLAMYSAPKICGEDPFGMGKRAANMYRYEMENAKNNAFNGEQQEEDPASELERSRA